MGGFDIVKHFFELDLHGSDRLAALADAFFALDLLAVVLGVVVCDVELGKLVAKCFFSFHHRLKLDEDGR